MLKLAGLESVFATVGNLYLLMMAAAVIFALYKGRTMLRKVVYAALALALFAAPVAPAMFRGLEYRSKLAKAQELFAERCKAAGVKIYKTIENVDSVVWMKWRDKSQNFRDQYKLDDPYGRDCGGEDCIQQLLGVTAGSSLDPEEAARHSVGYKFVESIDPTDGNLYRYQGVITVIGERTPEQMAAYKSNTGREAPLNIYGFRMQREPVAKFGARYGIAWDDLSTREDRDYWVAGGSLKLVDLQSNEIVAERIGYLFDRGQGSTAGFRTPWPWAQYYGPTCPSAHESTLNFAVRVLKP